MHLDLHLAECLQPVHSIWTFPFECFNGFLGAYHTNNKSIEVHIMKFLQQQQIKMLHHEDTFADFKDIC